MNKFQNNKLSRLVLSYKDEKGVISKISSLLSNNDINIANINVTREGDVANMVLETDSPIGKEIIEEISSYKELIFIEYFDASHE